MKMLRCSVVVVAVSFLGVLGTAQTSQAGPITYSFSGVLGDCANGPSCVNAFSGHTVTGQFTTDDALSTLLAASFSVDSFVFTWRILYPDTMVANSTTFLVSPSGLFIHETLLPSDVFNEDFLIQLIFSSPLTASAGSTLQSGFIVKGSVPINNPFVSGEATPQLVPEPTSLLLLATGITGLVARRRFSPCGNR